jgi:hypothetical protein
MPVLMFQVLEEDEDPEDAQKTFDLISSAEKELFWIENTTNAWAVRGNHCNPVIRSHTLCPIELRCLCQSRELTRTCALETHHRVHPHLRQSFL